MLARHKPFFFIYFVFFNFIQFAQGQEVLNTLNEIKKLIEKHYYRIDEIREKWPDMIAKTREKINHTASTDQQYQAIVELLDDFKHSHLSFSPPGKTLRSSLKKGRFLDYPARKKTGKNDQVGLLKLKENLKIEKRDDGILYLAFNAFTFRQVGKIKQAISENRDSKGMILDLRHNPGGAGMLACGIALEFCEKDYSLGTMTGPDLNLKFTVVAQGSYYKGPLMILINGRSFSTSEILARGMQVAGEATIIGTPTLGLALPSVMIKLDDGSCFQYPVADFRDAQGKLLESSGVEPDHLIEVTKEDIERKYDAQLEKAVALILAHQ